ncbi:hypothetical protein DFQ27_003622 [Actinomortierella ambigua]|uniref:Major facilitator superfamily (MFS) profile domain-containing protein n=1 Tax=Actinomortierella ambigua TaxID=1343610 RepID=A0A9P6Q4B1_9FUNG|nr:hypothetical protein DFQ27_003622 [Actinomortierella ambigua]
MNSDIIHEKAVELSTGNPCEAAHSPLPAEKASLDGGTLHNSSSLDLESNHRPPHAALPLHGQDTLQGSPEHDQTNNKPQQPKASILWRIRNSKHFVTIAILLALFTDMSTYGIIIPIMPGIIETMGGNSTWTGVLVAVYAAGIMSASLIFGTISDKLASRRLPMMAGMIGLLVATLLFMFAKAYWLLIVARFFQGVAGGAAWTLGLALMTDVFPANEMGVQMGKALIGHTMGMLGGPPIGGLLHDAFGHRAPFYFCIAAAAVTACMLAAVNEQRAQETVLIRQYEAEQRAKAVAEGRQIEEAAGPKVSILHIITRPRMIAAVSVTILEAFDLSSLEPTLPYYLRARFGMTEGQIGLVFIAFTMPTIISPFAGWLSDRYGAKILCSSAVLLAGAFMLVLSIDNKPLWGIVLTLVGIGAMTSAFIAPVLGEISAVVRRSGDKNAFARAFAIFNMAFSLGMLLGPIVAGYVYNTHGFKWVCIVCACVLFVFVPVFVLFMGDRKAKMEDVALYEAEEAERNRILAEIARIEAEKKRDLNV